MTMNWLTEQKKWNKKKEKKAKKRNAKKINANNAVVINDELCTNGWLRSKKGGIYKKTDKGTYAIFKFRNKYKTSFHSPSEGLTFFNITFDSIENARSMLDTYSVDELIQYSKK